MITTTHGDPQLFQDWPSAELNSMSSWAECILWCQSMLGPAGPSKLWNRRGFVFYFKNERDLTMFTLKWADKCM